MKIISYNVNGIRSAISKGFIDWLQQANPDVICLQEIKKIELNHLISVRKFGNQHFYYFPKFDFQCYLSRKIGIILILDR